MTPIGRSTWVAVAVAAAAVIAVVAVVASLWGDIGDDGMSAAGWVAMLLGVLATLGLGIGLMALVFISNRRGYDEPDGPRP
jgi:ABC-type multidrug transport system permease subunit